MPKAIPMATTSSATALGCVYGLAGLLSSSPSAKMPPSSNAVPTTSVRKQVPTGTSLLYGESAEDLRDDVVRDLLPLHAAEPREGRGHRRIQVGTRHTAGHVDAEENTESPAQVDVDVLALGAFTEHDLGHDAVTEHDHDHGAQELGETRAEERRFDLVRFGRLEVHEHVWFLHADVAALDLVVVARHRFCSTGLKSRMWTKMTLCGRHCESESELLRPHAPRGDGTVRTRRQQC
ncbi:hypothetical protein ON010_g15902 [Phytophthora cinnamomi]|nr:hypothetical protein ON010_g15902 [Phytophthora cinnamomi]